MRDEHREVVLVLCSAPDKAVARLLAQQILEERMAACVSVLPGMHSMYHWNGELQAAEEVLMIIKTTRDRLVDLQTLIDQRHPFDVPEVVVLDTQGGLPAWLAWVVDQTHPT